MSAPDLGISVFNSLCMCLFCVVIALTSAEVCHLRLLVVGCQWGVLQAAAELQTNTCIQSHFGQLMFNVTVKCYNVQISGT